MAALGVAQNVGSLHDIGVVAACTARNDALLHLQAARGDLIGQAEMNLLVIAQAGGFFLDLVQNVTEVRVQFINFKGIAGVERQRNHRLDGGQINIDHTIVIGSGGGVKLAVIIAAAMHGQEFAGLFIGAPNGGQAGGFGRHNVNAVAVIGGHARHAGTDELHDLILDIAVLEHCTDNRQCNILRADAGVRLAVQIDADDSGISNIIGVAQQLLDQLAAALANRHCTKRTIAGVRVRAQNHLTAAGHRLAHVLVDDGHVRRNVDAAVLAGGRQTKHVVILIDGAADGTQAVMAVRQHVGNRKFLHAGRASRLDNADERDVVGGQRIKFDLQLLHIAGGVVRF